MDGAGARPTAGTGPRRTMGLCVHPVLPRSRAGQASIWGPAKNSFPWRGPPHPLPGCPVTSLPPGWGQAPPTPPPSPGTGMGTCLVTGTGEEGLLSPAARRGCLLVRHLGPMMVIWGCGS